MSPVRVQILLDASPYRFLRCRGCSSGQPVRSERNSLRARISSGRAPRREEE